MRTFISYSHTDKKTANDFADFLRLNYIDVFLADRSMETGSVTDQIFSAMDNCQKFVVLISPTSINSIWVRREVAEAIKREQFAGRKFIPVLIESTPNWKDMHADIGDRQLVDWVNEKERWMRKLIEEDYNRPRHKHSCFQVGDVKIQVLIFVGGNGQIRYRDGDVHCEGPTDERRYQLPLDVAASKEQRIAEAKADCDRRGARFVNNPQIRLWDFSSGTGTETYGFADKPLRLKLGWTEYFYTRLTNQTRHYVLPCGNSIALKYGKDLENFSQSGLSNPIAVNMTVVTSDQKVFVATRSEKMAWNPGEFQPAVSGDGQPEDLDKDGNWDPFRTAIREAREECLGIYEVQREHVTFFGLARTMGTQFPFIFGEIRVPITAAHVLGFAPLISEGQRIPLDLTIEGVCEWVEQYHLDHLDGKRGGVIGTTLFSLLQSLHYAYPDRWLEAIERLTRKKS